MDNTDDVTTTDNDVIGDDTGTAKLLILTFNTGTFFSSKLSNDYQNEHIYNQHLNNNLIHNNDKCSKLYQHKMDP